MALNEKEMKAMTSSGNDTQSTPQDFFNKLHSEFSFELDVCCNEENKKCSKFYTEKHDGLKQKWNGVVWCNPPYSENKKWFKKAVEEIGNGNAKTIVMLIPSRTDTKFFHEYILPNADEIRFVKGRLKFNDSKNSAPFPSMVVIFRNKRQNKQMKIVGMDR